MSAEAPLLWLTILAGAFFGSWHCAGMCGPIAVALSRHGSPWRYHAGRGLSYILAGALAGGLGAQGLTVAPWWARGLAALGLGAFLIVTLFSPRRIERWGGRWTPVLLRVFRWNRRGLFAVGVLSVLLPCAWLWTFLAAAAATANPLSGGLVTFALWIGGLPAFAMVTGPFRAGLKTAPAVHRRWISAGVSVAGLYSLFSHFFF